MTVSYDIYINSSNGSWDALYSEGSNVSLLEVTNSDNQYYQTGFLELYDVTNVHNINDKVNIYINEGEKFSGYVSSREQTIEYGKKFTKYQLVGETYDLWRYHTDNYALYSGTTSYIASSLISSYCEDIGFYNYDSTDGYDITYDIDLSNITVGDAINRLTELDGYSFYVNKGLLHYYHPNYDGTPALFTITEEDLIGIEPIEESDRDIVNECLVVGGSGYSLQTNVSPDGTHYKAICKNKPVAQQFEAEDSVLTSVKLYLDRTKGDYQPSELLFEIWANTERTLLEDGFDNWGYLNSGNVRVGCQRSYNMQISGGYLCLATDGAGGYKTTGQIETYCYSGQYKNEKLGYDCRYMKLNLDTVVSSHRIYISGTNNSGATWKSLSDDSWIDFGSLNYSNIIRYKFSSNGDYTPLIGTSTVKIVDNSGGMESTVYNDGYDNYNYLSGMRNIKVNNSRITLNNKISPASEFYADAGTTNPEDWNSSYPFSKTYDHNLSSYGIGLGATYTLIYEFTNLVPYFRGIRVRWYPAGSGIYGLRISNIEVSGNWTCQDADGWMPFNDTNYDHTTKEIIDTYITSDKPTKVYSGIRKVKLILDTPWGGYPYLYEVKAMCIPYIYYPTGSFKISSVTTLLDTYYMKVNIPSSEYPHLLKLSGSANGGVNWYKLEPSEKKSVAYGKDIRLNCYMSGSGNTTCFAKSSNTPYSYSPLINSMSLVCYTNSDGGIPKSGTRIEFSDDLSFTSTDIVYPPSYSSWKSYSSPKLRLTEGEKYWLILDHASGSSKYWSFYYNSTSTYDGKICISPDNGFTWSSNSIAPTKVPAGNMRFKLGWTEGDITATSINQDSIDLYGRHFKKISDSSITTLEQAQARADLEVSGMTSVPKQGKFVVTGIDEISNEYLFSANLTNFGINEKFDIKSYTHRIDKNGFTTEIIYGKHPIDVAQKIARLENEVGL